MNQGDCERCLQQIGKQLGDKPYLFGDSPRVGDVALGSFIVHKSRYQVSRKCTGVVREIMRSTGLQEMDYE